MALQTCFLPHFPRTLQGRAKRTEASHLACGLDELRQLALPDMTALLASCLPVAFFSKAPGGVKARRVRLLPPVTVFWAFLYQVLNPEMACQEVVSKLRCWRLSQRHGKGAKPSKPALGTSGYCQARKALSLSFVQSAFEAVRDSLERRAASAWLWCGRRVKVLDGTSFTMPDTATNQKRWPQHCGQKKGCGFPTAKMLGLFCLSTGAWLGHSLGRWCRHDLSLLSALSHLLVKDDILLGDADLVTSCP